MFVKKKKKLEKNFDFLTSEVVTVTQDVIFWLGTSFFFSSSSPLPLQNYMGFNEWSDDENPSSRDKFRPERNFEEHDRKKRGRSPPEGTTILF